jgi:hypothetical protein
MLSSSVKRGPRESVNRSAEDAAMKESGKTKTMKTQIDIKSAVFGLIFGVATMVAIGAGSSSKEAGRYQVSAGQTSAVIVDTKTGQAWSYTPQNTAQFRTDSNFWDVK